MNNREVRGNAPGGRGTTRARRGALAALPVAAMLLLSSCGTAEPEVTTPSASDPVTTPTDAAPTDSEATSSEPSETTEATETTSEEPSQETTEATSSEPTETSSEPAETSSEPTEGAGDPAPSVGLQIIQEYAERVTSGDLEGAYDMLSPESMVYFPDVSVFETNGVPGVADDLSQASGEPQWAIRSAYEETHDSAQVVSVWGENGDGEPFAYSWAVRKLDGASWVIDQDITPSTGGPRLNWLNPGIQEGVEPWAVNPEQPIMFALLKKGGPNAAVTASIDDGALGSQQLTELPTEGAVMYELSDSDISQDGFSVVTASWVAEDDPFVHTSATPAGLPGTR